MKNKSLEKEKCFLEKVTELLFSSLRLRKTATIAYCSKLSLRYTILGLNWN